MPISTRPSPPRVSVALAVHNGELYLAEAVDSILTQSFRDFELLAVDDGSTDATAAILDGFARRDERVRVLRHGEKQGLPKSLNETVGLARGEYVARMDADDVSLPPRFERQVEFLDRHADCLAVGCRVLAIDEDGDPLWREKQAEDHTGIEWVLLRGMAGIPHPGAMFRRAAFLDVGGYREQFAVAQDIDLWLRLGERGRLANVPEILLKYRHHFGAASWRQHRRQMEMADTILREAYTRRGQPVPDNPTEHIPPPRSVLATRLEWSQKAAWNGYAGAAKKHAWSAVRRAPGSPAAWKAVIRALWYGRRIPPHQSSHS